MDKEKNKEILFKIIKIIAVLVVLAIIIFVIIMPMDGGLFKISGNANTDLSSDNRGSSFALANHNINCENNGIKQFHLKRGVNGDIKYEFTCSDGNLGTSSIKKTDINGGGNGDTAFLDRHNIDCGNNKILSQVHLNKIQGQDAIQFDYTCKESDGPLTCRNIMTPLNSWGSGNNIYLDRHDINCNDDEALNQFNLFKTGDQIQYKYSCCKY